ncbi:hypothetical protein CHS0354_033576 [Potamilus streckersoni]|uniref:Homeobox domain-containing protein n=1 Tax=Potamilus streckersoni TaxID=2493646 RepID=A0AAE0T0F5_9BIVA|nr:hypothetical protein CHS0354_033576 [Potamilus streckersoni]
MATFPTLKFEDSTSSDIEEKLLQSGRISLSDLVAATIGTLDSEQTSSSINFSNCADSEVYTSDDNSNQSSSSFKVSNQSNMLFLSESTNDLSCSTNADKSNKLTKQNESYDSDLDEACTFVDSDAFQDQIMTTKGTELRSPPSLVSASTIPKCESQQNTSLPRLLHSPPDILLNNPLFKDLQAVLLDECKMGVSHISKALLDACTPHFIMDVYTRERVIQKKFGYLQKSYPQKTDQLLKFFQHHFKLIEMERFKLLKEKNLCQSYRYTLHSHFDSDLHKIMDHVEKSLKLLDKAANGRSSNRYIPYIPRKQSRLSRRAVKMMEEWYARNCEHPYPKSETVEAIAQAGGITNEQVKKWFANKRNRCKNACTVLDFSQQLMKQTMA